MTELSDINTSDKTLTDHIEEKVLDGDDLNESDIDHIADKAIVIVRDILSFFDIHDVVINEYIGPEEELILDLKISDPALLIGRHGRTLESFQRVFNLIFYKSLGFKYRVVIDIEGYKARRRDKVFKLANDSADRSIESGKNVRMKPMPANERRLVHMELKSRDDVTTESVGKEPYRCVVIKPINKNE